MKKPKVLLVGSEGSIGKRYACILNCLEYKFTCLDPVRPDWQTDILPPCDRVLIASPTGTHYDWMKTCIFHKKDFLCEKPMSKLPDQCEAIVNEANEAGVKGYVVNNWQWALHPTHRSTYDVVSYDFYNTGRDGLKWDCCQLIYLNPEVKLNNKSPVWNVHANYRQDTVRVDYRQVELSYISMIDHWLTGTGSELWTLEDGLKMTRAVINYKVKK